MSKNAERYAVFYQNGFWTKEMLKNVVGKKITPEEYGLITGEEYDRN